MIKNALVASGGFGSRLRESGFNDPFETKPLIEVDGKSLLEINLEYLRESRMVEQALIATRIEIVDEVRSIAERVGLKFRITINDGHCSFRGLPLLHKELLNDSPFLLIAGHGPSSPHHIRKMVQVRETQYDSVVSLFPRSEIDGPYGTAIVANSKVLRIVYPDSPDSDGDSPTIETPFLLTPEVIEIIGKFDEWKKKYLQGQIDNGRTLFGVEADFPQEADYHCQMLRQLDYLRTRNGLF